MPPKISPFPSLPFPTYRAEKGNPPPPLCTPPMASSSENAGATLEEPQAPPLPNPNPSEEAPSEGEEEEPKTLERAQELFDRGSKAIEEEDFVDAVDCLSRALEIRLGFPLPPPLLFGPSCLKRPRASVEFWRN